MRVKILYIMWAVCQLTFISAKGQALEECEKDIHKFYTKSGLVNSDKGYYVKYGVQTIYKDKGISDKEIVFTMIYKNDQIHVKSQLLDTYADTALVISVSPMSKRIVVGNCSKKEFARLVTNATQMSDSLLWNSYTVASCKPVLNKKEYNTEVVLKSKSTNAAVSQMVYWYTKESSALYKMRSKYNKSSAMEELTYTFYAVDYSYNSEMPTKNVYSLIFDAKGKVLPAYKGYEVIDQRKSK